MFKTKDLTQQKKMMLLRSYVHNRNSSQNLLDNVTPYQSQKLGNKSQVPKMRNSTCEVKLPKRRESKMSKINLNLKQVGEQSQGNLEAYTINLYSQDNKKEYLTRIAQKRTSSYKPTLGTGEVFRKDVKEFIRDNFGKVDSTPKINVGQFKPGKSRNGRIQEFSDSYEDRTPGFSLMSSSQNIKINSINESFEGFSDVPLMRRMSIMKRSRQKSNFLTFEKLYEMGEELSQNSNTESSRWSRKRKNMSKMLGRLFANSRFSRNSEKVRNVVSMIANKKKLPGMGLTHTPYAKLKSEQSKESLKQAKISKNAKLCEAQLSQSCDFSHNKLRNKSQQSLYTQLENSASCEDIFEKVGKLEKLQTVGKNGHLHMLKFSKGRYSHLEGKGRIKSCFRVDSTLAQS